MDDRDKYQYRINVKLRRRNFPAMPSAHAELCSEEFLDDEEFCNAVAQEMLEQIKEDREYQMEHEDVDS